MTRIFRSTLPFGAFTTIYEHTHSCCHSSNWAPSPTWKLPPTNNTYKTAGSPSNGSAQISSGNILIPVYINEVIRGPDGRPSDLVFQSGAYSLLHLQKRASFKFSRLELTMSREIVTRKPLLRNTCKPQMPGHRIRLLTLQSTPSRTTAFLQSSQIHVNPKP